MIIFFMTTQESLCNKIAQRLMDEYDHIVRVFTNPRHCYRAVMTTGVSRIDMIACDYLMFDMEEINPFSIMSLHECVVPFFFYNTPFAELGECDRVSFWLKKIDKRLKLLMGQEAYEGFRMPDLEPVLKQIDEILSSSEIVPYVKLLSPPPVFPDSELSMFRQRNHIQHSRFKVLAYMFKHKNQLISEETLCRHVWNDFSPHRIQALYSYISELRKICSKDTSLHIKISRPSKQCYCLTVVS